jgi:hypothetical protein
VAVKTAAGVKDTSSENPAEHHDSSFLDRRNTVSTEGPSDNFATLGVGELASRLK